MSLGSSQGPHCRVIGAQKISIFLEKSTFLRSSKGHQDYQIDPSNLI